VHALVIGTVAGVLYSALFVIWGPDLYRLLGGRGAVLDEATRYGLILFSGALLVWLSSTLAAVVRGTGNMRVPSVTILVTSALQIALGGALGLGLGPLPALGMPGVAIGQLLATAAAVAFFVWYLRVGLGRLRLKFGGVRLNGEMFGDILKVGALACLSPLQAVLTMLIFTALIARLGVDTLAGYGIGQRLEFLLIPIAFGIGMAAIPMVGMAIGAGQVERARRVAWTAGGVSAFNLALIGVTVALAPDLWVSLFTQDEGVLRAGRAYLRWAGPAFPLFGLGLTLYFASQGSGKVLGPVLAATLRLALVATASAWLSAHGAPAWQYFALVAAGMTVYGVATAAAVRFTTWRPAGR
jgi:Na+-driven multidrug efflux pump